MIPLKLVFAVIIAASPAVEPPTLHPVKVPPGLAAVTTVPEFSGLAWSPTLERYLVVSDDTGRKETQTNHAPMVLGLSSQGILDGRPIPITGVESVNDAEAICPGPNGTYFLVTSHSPNRKGHTPTNRRQLLHLKEQKRSLAVLGHVDLTAIEGGTSLQEIAGLPADGRLDIEALAYDKGTLFVGLKSPLGARGAAVILRLADPVGAMRAGRIKREAISRWIEVPLCLDAGSKNVCQGFSDMTFLPDGSLVVSANAPKGGPHDGGGALWWLRRPVGDSAPVLLRRFAGHKPEGVALSPSRRSLMVVFDCGQGTPLWTELPLPVSPL